MGSQHLEHLHCLQDRYGYLIAAHLVALAQEMRLAMAEVYEVATFYHHFDVVGDDDPQASCNDRSCMRNVVVPDGGLECAS